MEIKIEIQKAIDIRVKILLTLIKALKTPHASSLSLIIERKLLYKFLESLTL